MFNAAELVAINAKLVEENKKLRKELEFEKLARLEKGPLAGDPKYMKPATHPQPALNDDAVIRWLERHAEFQYVYPKHNHYFKLPNVPYRKQGLPVTGGLAFRAALAALIAAEGVQAEKCRCERKYGQKECSIGKCLDTPTAAIKK